MDERESLYGGQVLSIYFVPREKEPEVGCRSSLTGHCMTDFARVPVLSIAGECYIQYHNAR